MILEVGSGWSNLHGCLSGDVVHVDIRRDAFHVEGVCDCHKLPFKDDVFDLVYCGHVLEHCCSPLLVLKELRRVSCGSVIVKVPNSEYSSRINDEFSDNHLFSWNYLSFLRLLSEVFDEVDVRSNFFVRYGRNKVMNVYRLYKATVLKLFFGDTELVGVCNC